MIITRLLDLFVEATAFLTDGQYYALILILSLGIGCAVAYVCERLQDWWLCHYSTHTRHVPRSCQDSTFRDAA